MTVEQAGRSAGIVASGPTAFGNSASPMEVAVVGGSRLALEIAEQWLQRISPQCGAHRFAQPADLLQEADACPGFDIVLLADYLLSGAAEGLVEAVRAVHQGLPTVPIIVVTAAEDEALIYSALRHGVRGYIPVRLPVELAVAAVKLVLLGGMYAPPLVGQGPSHAVPPAPHRPFAGAAPVEDEPTGPGASNQVRLSPRERDVLKLLKVGSSNRQIAAQLGISENTVMVHMRHLMRKLGVTNRTQAVCRTNELGGAESAPPVRATRMDTDMRG